MLTGGPGGIAWSDFISLPLPPPRTLNYTCRRHRGSEGWGLMGCWRISSCIMEEWIPLRILCVCVWHDGGECLLAILLQQFKRCVKNTWIINPICTRHVWVCVRECETQNAFERCDWKRCSASSVWMWVYSCVYAQQLPVCPQCIHSCYLWRTRDKHIRMYSCRLRLCSQNRTISFSATGSLLKRLWEVVICIHQEKCNQ